MRLMIASNNQGKVREIKEILGPFFDDVISLKEGGYVIDVVEDGVTFEENAAKKAREVMELTGYAALADDSGLAVDALNGAPGVYSARFSGEGATDAKNNAKLLELMKDVPAAERSARFICCMALAVPGKPIRTVQGSCEGSVLFQPRGEGGFGYDPLFFVPGEGGTFSEISMEVKNKISHRGKALRAVLAILEEEGL
ncbi:XTP/dITP diphosphatase [Gehongia tenuis]|uniref:dITP/XTP pyrophosphatase n=1 Tax=Gehongia tenuis TaxID=2763655 RepID=A0A926D6A3_9FIRM|nr:XTP/dITP diphosphatase [Gehongia tenuis]MBC8532168.1 XTP/dITP diphosphatase [Gehongia tenuis]